MTADVNEESCDLVGRELWNGKREQIAMGMGVKWEWEQKGNASEMLNRQEDLWLYFIMFYYILIILSNR